METRFQFESVIENVTNKLTQIIFYCVLTLNWNWSPIKVEKMLMMSYFLKLDNYGKCFKPFMLNNI